MRGLASTTVQGWSEQCQQDQPKWPWARQLLRRNLLTSLQISGTPGTLVVDRRWCTQRPRLGTSDRPHCSHHRCLCTRRISRPVISFPWTTDPARQENLGQLMQNQGLHGEVTQSFTFRLHVLWSLVRHDKLVGCTERMQFRHSRNMCQYSGTIFFSL